jgi:hypothetical protein
MVEIHDRETSEREWVSAACMQVHVYACMCVCMRVRCGTVYREIFMGKVGFSKQGRKRRHQIRQPVEFSVVIVE